MENTRQQTAVSGSVLILGFISALGIIASAIYSGYVAIACSAVVIFLAASTREPKSQAEKLIVYSLAALSVALGTGAIALGVIARTLSHIVAAG